MNYQPSVPTARMREAPEDWCDEPILFEPPGSKVFFDIRCHLGQSHNNDHAAIIGSADHDPPITIEVRWSRSA